MQREILVPLDGSKLAETALPHAAAVARARPGALTLLRTVPPLTLIEPVGGGVATSPSLWETWEKEPAVAREYLLQVANHLKEEGLEVQFKVIEGDPAQTIVHYALHNPSVKLIVMATHGRSGLSRWVFGSVAEKVLHGSSVPLLLVHSSEAGEQAPISPTHHYETILVPLDGSLFAEQALDEAQEMAESTGATLVLVSVLASPDVWQSAYEVPSPIWLEEEEEIEASKLNNYLFKTAERLRKNGLRVTTHLSHGSPAEEILRHAEHSHADLIAMATHGRSGLQRLWLGSVALKVVQGARLPVLLVRARERVEQQLLDKTEVLETRRPVGVK